MEREELESLCFEKAIALLQSGIAYSGTDLFKLTDTLIAIELEKIEKDTLADSKIDFNDEIISIEDVGSLETTDISVTGDNLFYCNGILTKNSFGIPAVCDAMFALIRTEQLDKMNQVLVKQLKNRYKDIDTYKRFTLGVDRSKMRLYDLEDPIANVMNDSSQTQNVATPTPFQTGHKNKNFEGFKV